HYFFFSPPRPPPRPSLFPYTTLFRSHDIFHVSACEMEERLFTIPPELRRMVIDVGTIPEQRCRLPLVAAESQTTADIVQFGSCLDRKSTRLNSSHRTISYAVFCLKKK